MEVKPTKGLKVLVKAQREAVFGEEGVSVQRASLGNGDNAGVMTGNVLAGFCEIEMAKLDGRKHWYPIGDLQGEHGETIIEEEIAIEIPEDGAEDEQEPA